ncbi:MAG: O-antigen ligase family protein [Patescibacteria group bacterium]|jgi:O-antigen ligase/tetratricopeptide (TPR) repeat protein|nr:O-antigen ligase family protein [Patescibacteria group bacterium]
MSQKLYKYILQGGIYLSLISVFLVNKNLLFPFITSKQIFFNVVIEVLMIFWIAMIVKYPSWRPKKNYITYGLAAFFGAVVVTSFTGVDFNLSFWGDVERMLGAFHLLHFFAFYLIIITAFRSWDDWKVFLNIYVFFAIFVALKGLSGTSHVYSTLGNTAYVAAFHIFSAYFAILLFAREKSWVIKSMYLPLVVLFVYHMIKTSVAGAYGGFAAGLLVMLFLYGILYKDRRIKVATVSAAIFIMIFGSYFFLIQKDNFLTRNSTFLNRVAYELSWEKNTFQTRLISWRAAFKDFPSHPLVGTGYGNYAITFDKYFDAHFYDQTRTETYFDRAHNNLVDILSGMGLFGLLTYLSIFFALGYYLISGYRCGKLDMHEFIIITSLITAYFVQNLAVFDAMVTYMAFMMVLAYVYFRYQGEEELVPVKDEEMGNNEIVALLIGGLILLSVLYQYNYVPYKMLKLTIDAQRINSSGGIVAAVDKYREALSYDSILDRDSRTSLMRLLISDRGQLESYKDKEAATEALDFIIEHAEKNVAYNKKDSMNQMLLAQAYNKAASFHRGNQSKYDYYINAALEAIDRSIEASPQRVPIYFQKAQILITAGQKDKALETLEYAYSLNENYYDSACSLAKAHFFYQDEVKGYEYMDQCIDKGGISLLGPGDYLKALIGHYVEEKDFEKVLTLYEGLVKLEPKDPTAWINLAMLYKESGNNEKAIEAATMAGDLDPKIKVDADKFIEEISR